MYAKRIQLTNYGPIPQLDILCPFHDDQPKPLVLVGENGSGKSIFLSHIVNGLLMAHDLAYPETPEIAKGKVYKFRSPSYVRSGCEFSFSRVEFESDIAFEELQLAKQRKDYSNAPPGISETPAQKLWARMQPFENSVFSPQVDQRRADELLERNVAIYLPPNRFEDPAWLNEDNLTAKARRMQRKHLKGHSDRTVINHSPLRDNENWLFDLAYDFSVFELKTRHVTVPVAVPGESKGINLPFSVFEGYSGRARTVYDIALRIIQAIIPGSNVRFGIGTRNHRVVSIMENEQRRVPNIFQLSSGEVALLNMVFG